MLSLHRAALLAALLLVACGDSDPPAETDAGRDAGGSIDAGTPPPAECRSDADCDDGVFCTGEEACDPDDPSADARGCVIRLACGTHETCDEAADRCVLEGCEAPDADGDGHRSLACGGPDCDDEDALRYPGAPEICDVDDRDEDCDPTTYGYRDTDRDDHPDQACCNGEGDARVCGDDCNDMAASTYAGAPDICDGRDNDCDGVVDEEGLTLYLDCDGDGFGNTMVPRTGCPAPVEPSAECPTPTASSTWVSIPGDCDDQRTATYPGATDQCNGIDDDCTLPIDPPTCACTDGETTSCGYDASCRVVTGTCRSGAFDCPPGLRTGAEPEVCDGIDNNCVDGVDESCPCAPVGSSRPCSIDHDGTCGVGTEACTATGWAGCPPPGTETCSSGDQDCDGRTDEGLSVWRLTLSVSGTPTCDRVHMAHTCAREISHACRMTTPPGGACGAVGGYGHVEFSGDSMDVICMQNLVRITGVQPAALQATGVFCDANDANFSGCRAAINRYCASMGHASGFGFPDSFEGTFTVNCIPTSVGAAFNRPWSALAAINPGCAGPNPHNIYCPHAVHHWCRANGFASGWGTVEHNASNVVFVCVRNL